MLADPLAGLHSPEGALISLYLDRPDPGGMAALITDLLRPVRARSLLMSKPVVKSVRSDAERIHEQASQLEADPAPSFAVFASSLDDIFEVQQLTHQVESTATLGTRPYLRPLRAAPRLLRAGVIVADRAEARTFLLSGDLVEELGDPLNADIGKANYGGFSGYEEHTVRSRAEEVTSRLWREAAARLLPPHQERPLDFVAIGSHEEFTEEIGRGLHPYLADVYRASFVAKPQGLSQPMLRAELADLSSKVRRDRQTALAGHVCDTAWSGGDGVVGLSATIEAANVQAIDTLAVAGPFARSGSVCRACGHLARFADVCPVCGNTMDQVDDVVAAVMESVVAHGGRVHQIRVASPLDAQGVGALTRFKIKS